MPKNQLQFATLHVKFGNADLLDYAEQVVFPAFFEEHERDVKGARYFFSNQKLVKVDEGRYAIAFDFVKDTTIGRERFVDANDVLVDAPLEEPAAFTGRAVLLLNNHRLLYCGTTYNSPGLESLRSTIAYFIRTEHLRFCQRLLEERSPPRGEVGSTRMAIFEEHPTPKIELEPLTSTGEISRALLAYKTVTRLSLRIIRQNAELNDDYFIEQLHASHVETHAQTTQLVQTGPLCQGSCRLRRVAA